MSDYNIERIAQRILDDYRSTDEDKRMARRLQKQYESGATVADKENARSSLQRLFDEVSQRSHLSRTPAVSGRAGHASLAWVNLAQELTNAEEKWSSLARVQFWLGILTVPIVLLAVGLLVVLVLTPLSPAASAFTSILITAAVAHSFLVLRIHQQARLAEERIVEKRVGLSFLRIAVEDYAGKPQFEQMLAAGTNMFLGHYAPNTIPLNADDLKATVGAAASIDK